MKLPLLLFLAFPALVMAKSPTKNSIEGVWMGVSHQTVTITACRADGTFSGTYFTPSLDVRAVFAGNWILKSDTLILTYTEASSPVFRVPLEDRNRVEMLSKDALKLSTLPSGVEVVWKRVVFPEHALQKAGKVPFAAPPTTADILALTENEGDSLYQDNKLQEWIRYRIHRGEGATFDEKELHAITQVIPRKAAYYYAIYDYCYGTFNIDGAQALLLKEPHAINETFLKLAEEGFRFYGAKKSADFLKKVIPKTKVWMTQLAELESQQAEDAKYQLIWDEVDSYEGLMGDLFANEDPREAMIKDMKAHPREYTVSGESTGEPGL